MVNTNQIVDEYYEEALNQDLLFIWSDREEELNLLMHGDINTEVPEDNKPGVESRVGIVTEFYKGQEGRDARTPERPSGAGYDKPLSSEGLHLSGAFPF